MEELSAGDTAVHRLNPSAKLLAAFVYLVCIMSLERHSVTRLSPFLFYPVLMCAFASVPAGLLLKRVSLPSTRESIMILAAGAVATLPLLPLRSLIPAAYVNGLEEGK